MKDVWAAPLADFIRREVSKDSRQTIEADTPLISSGLVDSFSLMKVLVFIEDDLGVVIPDEAATAAAMDSVSMILDLMERFSDTGDA